MQPTRGRAATRRRVRKPAQRTGRVSECQQSGVDPADLTDWMARFVASQLDSEHVEAAALWAESPPSQRLEGVSAERAAAEELATLRATRAIDIEAIRAELAVILQESPA